MLQTLLTDKTNQELNNHGLIVNELLTVGEAADLLSLTSQTIYGLVYERKIPFSKQGKRLYFIRQDLLDWVKSGRQKTANELDEQARQIIAVRQNRRLTSKERKGGRRAA
ncbi:helix-turn-helix domain-containing protein [Larkinella humicola]|uniref:Helix-turn-helix domain-containing protein n=2 Tax=Larkinella humicola TaxID=2607654 RepID=A0A5N1JFX3_9BACT|nr:helix-turn-helix domain-containing protein [Larkinella humicola]